MSILDDDDAFYEEAFKIADQLSQNNVKNTNNYPKNLQHQANPSYNQNRPPNNYSAPPKRQFVTPNPSSVKSTNAARSVGPFFPPSSTNNAVRPTPTPASVNQHVQQTASANRPMPSFPKANPKFAYNSLHNNGPNPNVTNNPPPVVRPAFASGDNIMSPKVFKVGNKKNTQAGPGSARPKGSPAIQIPQNNTPTKQRAVASEFPVDDVFDVDHDLLQSNNKPMRQQLTFRSAYAGDNDNKYTNKKVNNNNVNNNTHYSNNTESVFETASVKKAATKPPTKRDPFGTKLSTDFPRVVENCDDPPIVDEEAIKTWIYPSNKQMRDYQFDIVQKGLYENTLVCLPTGLGKTFIAAVIMLNFYRWFPLGKLVFMAPTKPLVNQQIEACHSIAGLPQSDMIQMVGTMAPAKRRDYWMRKRIFFVTPQIFENDLNSDICPGKSVVLLIIDEAHKAQGNFAYCNAVTKMATITPFFRVIALSATPGKNVETIQSVICNLLIAGLSVRTDEDDDVKNYIHSKQLDVVKVQLGPAIVRVREAFLKVAAIPINELVNQNCFYTRNVAKLTRGAIFSACQKYRSQPPHNIEEHHKPQIEALFGVSTTLFHAWDLLNNHGLSQFRTTITELKNKEATKKVSRFHMELVRTEEFKNLIEVVEEVAESGSIDHPKLKAVEQIINGHFENNESEETRVMIFVEYRDSVELITNLLKNYEPRVKPSQFIGQASGKTKGLSQREQQEVLQKFKAGVFNTLVATCIGEEGLDIGEVDLIICYDAAISPVRIIQRMGRTGRKRDGRCGTDRPHISVEHATNLHKVMLMTEGQEEGAFLRTNKKKNTLFKSLVKNAERTYTFYTTCPRMVPDEIDPEVEFRLVDVDEWEGGKMTPVKAKTKSTSDAKSKAASKKKLAFDEATNNNNNNNNGDPLEEGGDEWYLNEAEHQVYLSKYVPPNNIRPVLKINRFIDDQALPSRTFHVGHSSMSRTLTRAIQFSQFGETGEAYGAQLEEWLQWEDVEIDGLKSPKPASKSLTKLTTTTATKRPIDDVIDVDDDFKTSLQPPKKKQKTEQSNPVTTQDKPADTFKVPSSVPKATVQSTLKLGSKPAETKAPEVPSVQPAVESKGVMNVKSKLSKFAFKGEEDYEPTPAPQVPRPQPIPPPKPAQQTVAASPAKPKQPNPVQQTTTALPKQPSQPVHPPKQSVVSVPIPQPAPVPVVNIPCVQLDKPKDNMEVALDQELDDFFNSSQDFDLGNIVDVPPPTSTNKTNTNQSVQSVNTPQPAKPTQSNTNQFDNTSFDLDVNISASLDIFDDDAGYSLRIPSPPQSQLQSMNVDSEPSATDSSALSASRRQQTPKTAPLAQSSAQVPTQRVTVPTIGSPVKQRAPVQSSPIKLPSPPKLNTLPLVQGKSSPLDNSSSPKSNSSLSLSLPSTPQPKARRRLQMSGQTSIASSLLTANKKRFVADDSDIESISDVDEDEVMKDVADNNEDEELDDDIEMSDSDSSPVKPKKKVSLKSSSALVEAEAEESGEEDVDSDEERSNSDDDRNLSGFITSDDDTSPPSQSGNVNMQAIYLRSLSSQSSVRPSSFTSPKRNGAKFKLNEKLLKQREKQRKNKKKKKEIVDDIEDFDDEKPQVWMEKLDEALERQTRLLMDEPITAPPLPVTPVKIAPKIDVPAASPDMFEFEDLCSDSPKNKISSIPPVPSTLKPDAFVAVNNDSIAGPMSDSSGFMDEDIDMGFDDFSLGLTFGDMSVPSSNVATNNTNVPFLTPTAPSTNTASDLTSSAIDSTAKPRVKEPPPKRIAVPVDHVTVVASPEDFNTTLSTHFAAKKSTVLTSSLLSSEYILADNVEGSIALRRHTSGLDDAKFLQRLNDVSQKYKYCYLIVEADGKLSPTHERVVNLVLEITQTKDIRVVFANDALHSAVILHGLASYESGCAKPMSDLSGDWLVKHEKFLNFLLSVPSVNFSTAVRLITHFKTMKEVIAASVGLLQERIPGMSQDTAKTLFNYFRLSISGSVHN